MKRFLLVLATFLGLAATALPASADISWTLNQGGSLGPTPGNYGTVTAAQIGTGSSAYVQVTITLTSNPAANPPTSNYFVTTGQHSGIVWNMAIVPDSVTVSSGNASLFTVQPLNPQGGYADAPASTGGNFQYAISWNGNGAGSASENSITFDIKKSGGLLLTNNLFTANGGGYYWAADIGLNCTRSQNGKTSCAGGTGVVAANTYTQVPEPGTWTMSVAGLMGVAGLIMLQRRRKQAQA